FERDLPPSRASRNSCASICRPNVKRIADAGPILAALDPLDRHHPWAADAFRTHAPFYTCDAIIAEVAAMTRDPAKVLELVTGGELILDPSFILSRELPRVLALIRKFARHSMDLTDAC